jgi:SAM-dependent methyltransferase
MAHPVRQWVVAASASRLRDSPCTEGTICGRSMAAPSPSVIDGELPRILDLLAASSRSHSRAATASGPLRPGPPTSEVTATLYSSSDLRAFVEEHLPPPPARVLEVGCGRGELARAIAGSGHRVVAIDPEAPAGELFRAVSLEEFADADRFAAVVASRVLHHVADLAAALEKIARLLRPGGRVIVNEHAWDRLDAPTARWYMERRAAVEPGVPRTLELCLADWERDHAGLHTYTAMRRELDGRFRERFFAWTPYLYGELPAAVDEDEEGALIEAGEIQATGFRYVGEPRSD